MSDVISKKTVDVKQAIIDEGLYEEGMTIADMEQLYKTLYKSKRTANEENEYRELLSQTDANCSNIELIKTNAATLDSNNEGNLSNEEVLTNHNEDTGSKTHKSDDITVTKDITFNYNSSSKLKTVVIEKQTKNIIPILYHQPFLRMIPVQQKLDIIKLYLRYEKQKNNFNENFVDQWGKPIIYVPKQHDYKEASKSESPNITQDEENIPSIPDEPNHESPMTLRSSRLIKRKNYTEFDSDDETSSVQNKKTKMNPSKSSCPVQKNTGEMSNLNDTVFKENFDSDFELSPIINKNKLSRNVIVNKSTTISKSDETNKTTWFSKSSISDRTNKILNKLKDKENKNTSNNEKIEEPNLSDSSEDIFPSGKYNPLEVTPKQKRRQNSIRKKLSQTKTRKKLGSKSTNEEQDTSTNSEISTTSFYSKNKKIEVDANHSQDASNNNKNCADMVECPICSKPFSNDKIEDHAAQCEQYIEEEKLCVICNKSIEKGESNAHAVCLEQITENSIKTTSYDKNKNKAESGFLCFVCDKYVVDSNQFEHASNCIATVEDG